jgi:hypothetical protein
LRLVDGCFDLIADGGIGQPTEPGCIAVAHRIVMLPEGRICMLAGHG